MHRTSFRRSNLKTLTTILALSVLRSLVSPTDAHAAPVEVVNLQPSRVPAGPRQRIIEIRSAPDHVASNIIRINVSELAVATSLDVPLPDGPTATFSLTDMSVDTAGNFVWHGENTARGAKVRVVVEGSAALVRISTPTATYSTRSIQGEYYVLIKHDLDALPDGHTPEFEAEAAAATDFEILDPSLDQDGADVVIDIMVGYTDAASEWAGSDDHAIALARSAVDQLNEVNVNSNVHVAFNLVHVFETSYVEAGTYEDRERLISVADGHLDNVHALRNQYRADVVVLLADNDDYCGIAGGILPASEKAFAVLSPGCATANVTFAHEVGHLLGARHDLGVDNTDTPFPFGHGYVEPNGALRTVMAYGTTCPSGTDCPRIEHWSNPAVSYNGLPTGVIGSADNASVINSTAFTISQYRQPGLAVVLDGGTTWGSTTFATSSVFAEVDGDAFDELIVTRNSNSGPRYWVLDDAVHGFAELHTGGHTWGSGNYATSVAAGDIDGDGLDEIVVGRRSWENYRFQVFDDALGGFDLLFDGGDSWLSGARAVAVAMDDIDGDGLDELVVGREQEGCGLGCPRVFFYDDALHNFAILGDAATAWGEGAELTGLTTGDVDGDGDAEVGLSRETPINDRYFILDGPDTGFSTLHSGGSDWSSDVGATSIAMGDPDLDGRAEVAVGRTSTPDFRWLVVDDAWTGFPVLHEGSDHWNSSTWVTGVDFADVDGDGADELAVSRNSSFNARYFVYDDIFGGFEQLVSGGDSWGSGNYATGIALGDPDDDGQAEMCVTRHATGNGRYFVIESGL